MNEGVAFRFTPGIQALFRKNTVIHVLTRLEEIRQVMLIVRGKGQR
jgi:hypothetical protein